MVPLKCKKEPHLRLFLQFILRVWPMGFRSRLLRQQAGHGAAVDLAAVFHLPGIAVLIVAVHIAAGRTEKSAELAEVLKRLVK